MLSYHTCPLASFEGKETGGMNVFVLELAKALGKLDISVDLFTRSQDTKQPHLVMIRQNVRLFHVPAGPERPFPKNKLRQFIPEFSKNVATIIKNQPFSYDIFHAHYYLSGLAALPIHKSLGHSLPLVTTFHTLALMKNLVARSEEEKEDVFRVASERQLIKESKILSVPSDSDRTYLNYLYDCPPEKISVIPPGVDTTLFHPIPKNKAKKVIGADSNHKIILFVGRIEPLKGIDTLIYALKILRKRLPQKKVCLWIVGGDVSQKRNFWSQELKRLEALRHDLSISTVVIFKGQQPQCKLPYYYNASDVVVMPSHYESFGMAALEAMACGIPVIATNVSGISTLINQSQQGVVSSANNPILLSRQIEKLLTAPKTYETLCKKEESEVKNFTWENTAQKTLEIYTSITH